MDDRATNLMVIDRVADDFDRAWQEGENPRIEEYLQQYISQSNAQDVAQCLRELLLVELEVRCRNGQQPCLEDYRHRFPDAIGVVQSVFWDFGPTSINPFPGEFRVVYLLGFGRFGKVWLAEDLNIPNRKIALKTLRGAAGELFEESLRTLRNEAVVLAGIRRPHPNIVQVHGWRTAGDDHYLLLQFVDGCSLCDRLRREHTIPWDKASAYVADVAEGLMQIHKHGIVHRDIKPANILWDAEEDEALITDFGVAVALEGANSVAGTPHYMAPEAWDGTITPAMDTYSLSATLFHLITGEVPFSTRSSDPPEAIKARIATGLPNPDTRCNVMPDVIERVIRAGLSANPDKRPNLVQFVSTLRTALNTLLADTLIRPSRGKDSGQPVHLHLVVSRWNGHKYEPLNTTAPRPVWRDMRRVPVAPERVSLTTGDRIEIATTVDCDGYVWIFNIGPTGRLNLLHPHEFDHVDGVSAAQPLHVRDIELTSPAGRERLFALWTRNALMLRPNDLLTIDDNTGDPTTSPQYRATRDMKTVRQSLQRLRPEDWYAIVLELDHEE